MLKLLRDLVLAFTGAVLLGAAIRGMTEREARLQQVHSGPAAFLPLTGADDCRARNICRAAFYSGERRP